MLITGPVSNAHNIIIIILYYTLPPSCTFRAHRNHSVHERARHACPINISSRGTRATDLHWLSHTILSKLHSPGFFPYTRPSVDVHIIHNIIFSYIIRLFITIYYNSFIRLFYFRETIQTIQPRISSEVIPNPIRIWLYIFFSWVWFVWSVREDTYTGRAGVHGDMFICRFHVCFCRF